MAEYEDQATDGDDEPKEKEKTPGQWASYWTKEMSASAKRMAEFHKRGDRIVDRFIDERASTRTGGDGDYGVFSLNLFHTNVVTQQSMLYGSIPKVDIAREHHDPDDDPARVAALMYQRILQADVDPSGSDFPSTLKANLLDRLLPGLGQARVRYEFESEESEMIGPDGAALLDEEGEPILTENLIYEEAPCDYVHWTDFAWGWGRTWPEVPWVAFRSYLGRKESTGRFGKKKARQLDFKVMSPDSDDAQDSTRDMQSVAEKAEIWEIWCKDHGKVFWWSKGCRYILDEQDDPLGLEGFFPCPKPMIANQTTKLVMPTADFIIAQDTYDQIDTLYTRICIITRALKVVGVYNGKETDSVGRMLKEGNENDLIPVENWAMFAESGGLRGAIDWFPVSDVAQTLGELKNTLQAQIELLYQVTGLSDILRGASSQYSGVGQDQMKAKFGSIRVQALQEDFARFASDLETLRAEVIAKHFEPATIAKQAAAQFLPKPDQAIVPQALELMKSPDEKWRVEIKPESIAMIDYQSMKQERTEFITAVATYIQSAQAMAREMPGSLPVLLEMLKWTVAGFKGANYLEGILDQAIDGAVKAQQQQQQQPEQPSEAQLRLQTEQLKAQAQQAKSQADIQKIQTKAAADMQVAQQKLQARLTELQTDLQGDSSLESLRMRNRLAELDREFEQDIAIIREQLSADVAVEEAQSTFAIAEEEVEHSNELEILARQFAASRNTP